MTIAMCSAVLSSALFSAIYTMSTDLHPLPSTIKAQFFIGNPTTGVLIFESAPLNASGSVLVGDPGMFFGIPFPNTIMIQDLQLSVEDIPLSNVNLEPFGSATIRATGIQVEINQALAEVTNGQLQINVDDFFWNSNSFFSATAGILELSNPTGLVATFLPDGYFLNLGANPVFAYLSYLPSNVPVYFDSGPGGLTTRPELSLGDPTLIIDTDVDDGLFTIRYIADLHFAAIPELGSFELLASAAVIGSIAVYSRRLMKA